MQCLENTIYILLLQKLGSFDEVAEDCWVKYSSC